MKDNPIGILDSGVGGITLCKDIIQALPHESIVYIGDSMNIPYGAKHADEIYRLAKKMIDFLLQQKVKLILIGCNTITVSAIEKLRSEYPDIPIVGTVPIVKKAAELSQSKRIGILSTTSTAQSDYQKELIKKFASNCTVLNYGTDALVPLIEKGEVATEAFAQTLNHVLKRFENIDTLALGCTHYPFVRKQIQEIMGPKVTILDSGSAIARQIKRVLENNKLLREHSEPTYIFNTTANKALYEKIVPIHLKIQALFHQITL